jgi:hypothetical protein
LYNKFNQEEGEYISGFLKERAEASFSRLREFYPRQTREKTDRKLSGKTLRNSSPSYFVAVRGEKGRWYHPFQMSGREVEKPISKFKEMSPAKALKLYESLQKAGFDTSPVINKMTPTTVKTIVKRGKAIKSRQKSIKPLSDKELLRFAHDSDCPLPITDLSYNSEIGLHNPLKIYT